MPEFVQRVGLGISPEVRACVCVCMSVMSLCHLLCLSCLSLVSCLFHAFLMSLSCLSLVSLCRVSSMSISCLSHRSHIFLVCLSRVSVPHVPGRVCSSSRGLKPEVTPLRAGSLRMDASRTNTCALPYNTSTLKQEHLPEQTRARPSQPLLHTHTTHTHTHTHRTATLVQLQYFHKHVPGFPLSGSDKIYGFFQGFLRI